MACHRAICATSTFSPAGILAQSTLFVAIFYGISAIWERDLGVLQRYLVSPAPRSALVIGKALSAGVRAISQAVFVYVLALALGVGIDLNPISVAGVIIFIVLGSSVFATLSVIIACVVKTRERFMGIGQVLTMPIFFASNAIYPLSLNAGLATRDLALQSTNLRGGRIACPDAQRRRI